MTPTDVDDQVQMSRALRLAERGLYTTDPNPRVGCVLVRDGQVVGEGWHRRAGEAHAEVLALRAAGDAARGATAYVTLEPCSHQGRTGPCADALVAAGVARVACAVADPNPLVGGAGIRRLRDAGIDVSVGVMSAAARELNAGFFSRFERARPYVRLKLAMSLDGRTAGAGGQRLRITGDAARQDVQRWRARSSAVLTGAGTIRSDDPRLDVRLDYGPWVRQPLRIVLDPQLRCDPGAQVFRDRGALLFAARTTPAGATPAPDPAPDPAHAPVRRVGHGPAGLDLREIMTALCELEVNELLVECGARLAGSFIGAALVDELIVYVAPHLLGAAAAPLAELAADGAGAATAGFAFHDVRRFGADLRIVLRPGSLH